jgi:hypothetical protein
VCSQPPCASCHCCLAVRVLSTNLCCTLSDMSRVVLIVDRCAVERPSRQAAPRYAMHTHILLTCTFLRTERRLFKHYGMFEFLLHGKRPVTLTVLTLPVVPPPLPPPLDESVTQEDWLINNPPSDKDSVRNTPRCRCCRGTVVLFTVVALLLRLLLAALFLPCHCATGAGRCARSSVCLLACCCAITKHTMPCAIVAHPQTLLPVRVTTTRALTCRRHRHRHCQPQPPQSSAPSDVA